MLVVIVMKWDLQDGENNFLKIIELRYKAIVVPVGQLHLSLDDIFELFQHVLAARITDILFIWHQSVQASIPIVDIISGGSFEEHRHLQSDFEQKQKRFDSLRGMQVDGLNAVRTLGPAKGVLAFVLVLVSLHGFLDTELPQRLVG
jgi:hypothetical protein